MRKLMWLTIGFGGACILGAYCYNPWLLPIAVVFLLMAGIFFFLSAWKISFRIACAACLGAAIGLSVFNLYDLTVLQNVRLVDGNVEKLTIDILDYSYPTESGCAFDGQVTLGERSYKVRVYLNTQENMEPGHRIAGDFRLWMTFWNGDDSLNNAGKGIFLSAYQNGEYTRLEGCLLGWQQGIAMLRHDLKAIISEAFPSDAGDLAKALLLGDTADIDYETDTALKVSGIRHVVAISGLHISTAFGLLYLLAGKKRVLTILIGVPGIVLFSALTGFTPSVTRACVMQILMMLALLFDKEYDPPTALAFAVLVMLCINPMAIGSVSFQLSVGCMIGIFLFGERIYNRLIDSAAFGKGKLSNWIYGSVSITLSTMVTTVPLTAFYFGTISIIGIVTNLIVLWAITVLLCGIMLVCALGYIWLPLAQFVGCILAWLIRYVKAAAAVMASVPLGAVYTKSVYIVLWLIFAYVLLSVYLLIKKKPAVLFSGLLICALCIAVFLSWVEPIMCECRVTMLDVGQGQAILLQSEGKTFLVDCGGDYDTGASDITAETLLSQGVAKLDGIILTHYDGDHAGGLPYLLTRVGTENLFLPWAEDTDGLDAKLEKMSNATVHTLRDDIKISYGNAELTIFAPVSYNSGNESSMCVLFQTENCDILIVGDRSEKTERILVSRYDLPELDVLVAGHHGSKTSTSIELLEETKPEYAFISVGKGNPYGHPAQQTIDRLLEFGCKILRTDQCGTVIFRR